MRPIYDALKDLLGFEAFQRYYEKGLIEVSPLAFMRGRTLDDSFILLDEAQNTTIDQMIMFLTRIGMNSKACVCGDITQIDLPPGIRNGLSDAVNVLSGIDGIKSVFLSSSDIVRNPIVQKIVRAYQKDHSEKEGSIVIGTGKAERRSNSLALILIPTTIAVVVGTHSQRYNLSVGSISNVDITALVRSLI